MGAGVVGWKREAPQEGGGDCGVRVRGTVGGGCGGEEGHCGRMEGAAGQESRALRG